MKRSKLTKRTPKKKEIMISNTSNPKQVLYTARVSTTFSLHQIDLEV